MDRPLEVGARACPAPRRDSTPESPSCRLSRGRRAGRRARSAERVVRPVLAVDRHHVGMAGQDVARRAGGPDRRPQIGLLAGLVGDALVGDPEPSRYSSTQAIRSRLELRLVVSKPTSASRISVVRRKRLMRVLDQAAASPPSAVARERLPMMQSKRPRSSQFAAGTRLASMAPAVSDRPAARAGGGPARVGGADNERMDAAFHGGAVGRMDRRRQRAGSQDRPVGRALHDGPALPQPRAQQFDDQAHLRPHLDQDEQQQIKPRPCRVSWRTLDETTWEFKLRPGVKFTDGSDFTANDVIYPFCRVPQVENSPSSMAINVRAITAMTAPDPMTLMMKTASPHPLLPSEIVDARHPVRQGERRRPGHVRPAGVQRRSAPSEDRGVQCGPGRDRHRPVQALALHQGRPRDPRAQRMPTGAKSRPGSASSSARSPAPARASRRCCRATST